MNQLISKLKNILMVVLVLLLFQNLISQDLSDDENKKIEKKWDYESGEINSNQKFYKEFISNLKPAKQVFKTNPASDISITGEKGTKISIQKSSFILPKNYKEGGLIEIELTEVKSKEDFIGTGIDLEYHDSNGHSLFESGGMFSINVTYKGQDLSLKKDKQIEVEFTPSNPEKPYKVYQYNSKDTKWELDQENNKQKDKSCFYYEPGSFSAHLVAQAAPSSGCGNSEDRMNYNTTVFIQPVVFNNFIPSEKESKKRVYTYWNFDFPQLNITCISGKILVKNKEFKDYSVIVYGTSITSYTRKYFYKNEFKLNVIQNAGVKILILDSNGYVGISGEIMTGKDNLFLDFNNYETTQCKEIPSIKVKKEDIKKLKTKSKILEMIGLTN